MRFEMRSVLSSIGFCFPEGEHDLFFLMVTDFHRLSLFSEFLLPGPDFILARWNSQFECTFLMRHGMERVSEGPDESVHPFLNIAADWNQYLRLIECCLSFHVLDGLPHIERHVDHRPNVNVVERGVTILYDQRLMNHDSENVGMVPATALIDDNRLCWRCKSQTFDAGIYVT